jgi:N-acetylmuramic acid 6-phosphate etherase
LRFLIDENIFPPITSYIRKLGHDAKTVQESGLIKAPDDKIVDLAIKEKRTIITFDKHFGDTLRYPPQNLFGIILIRIHPPILDDIFHAISNLFKNYQADSFKGRLGVLDASECPPTFGTDPELVRGIIAGGTEALTRSIEGAEDRHEDGEQAIKDNGINAKDTVVGIATGGTTPFVHGALVQAKRIGATTIFLCCNPDTDPIEEVDVIIRPITGPEVITGSTRMKAGTATKLVLNTLTTASMIKMGKVYENLMVDLQVKNEKLKDRAERIIMTITDLDRDSAQKLLAKAKGNVKTAIVMHKMQIDYEDAKKKLNECEGFVRKVLSNL